MIKYITGDLFSHKVSSSSTISILAHACNCHGSWGAGIAAVFYKKFPSAYKIYADHCKNHSHDRSKLLGTTLLIPASPDDPGSKNVHNPVYIACLFTSDFYGAKKLSPPDIVDNTDMAMQDLIDQLNQLKRENTDIALNMPKINAGLFNVRWEDTESVLKKYVPFGINVYTLD